MSMEATQEQKPELYLIAHKVRGEPAFDIAHRLQIGDEEGWIIPTSGHRAYPYWSRTLNMFLFAADESMPPCPLDWPDHYTTTAAPRIRLADVLGFTKPKPTTPIRRI